MPTALVASLLVAAQPFLGAEESTSPTSKEVSSVSVPLEDYVNQSGRVSLKSGEPMQITCIGDEGPTAVLLAGSGGWSDKWSALHDDLARVTRSCTIDRPGWGMAGIGRGLTSLEMVEDYREALAAADEMGPYIIVGHSLGGEEAVFWADKYRHQIAGLVLVDPSRPDLIKVMAKEAPAAFAEMSQMVGGAISYFRSCAEQIDASQAGESVDLSQCHPRARNENLRAALTSVSMNAERFRYNADGMAFFLDAEADTGSYSGELGDLPILILQATIRKPPPGLSEAAAEQSQNIDQAFVDHHDILLSYSSRAKLRQVADAGHDILADRPGTVVQALADLLAVIEKSD